MKPRWYKLDGKAPVACTEQEMRMHNVAKTDIGPLHVSTVFLALDHRLFGEGEPLLFETMIFGDGHDYQVRTSTWEQAEAAHTQAVEHARATVAARLSRFGIAG